MVSKAPEVPLKTGRRALPKKLLAMPRQASLIVAFTLCAAFGAPSRAQWRVDQFAPPNDVSFTISTDRKEAEVLKPNEHLDGSIALGTPAARGLAPGEYRIEGKLLGLERRQICRSGARRPAEDGQPATARGSRRVDADLIDAISRQPQSPALELGATHGPKPQDSSPKPGPALSPEP
jgi:hypothetical protein